jgi:Zn-dependent peptidase ImmA (M78 family)
VEAITDFVPGQRPRVRISHRLSDSPRREHRLRTTLAHELAHVVFHNFIWWFDQGALAADQARALSPRCHRRRQVATDWMEWQASYASGALLVPASAVGAPEPVWVRSFEARRRIEQVHTTFDVSMEAARVRLQQLGQLSPRPTHVLRAPMPR